MNWRNGYFFHTESLFLTCSKHYLPVGHSCYSVPHKYPSLIIPSRLRATNIKIKFVTNTTKESKRVLHERLKRIGFGIDREEIFTSLTAARQLIDQRNLRPYMLVADAAKEDFDGVSCENENAVLVGLAPEYFNYEHMTAAFRLVS